METEQPCRIEDVRYIKMRMFDGVKSTLIQVRFLPNMRKKPIFLRVLDSYSLEWNLMQYVLNVRLCDQIIP